MNTLLITLADLMQRWSISPLWIVTLGVLFGQFLEMTFGWIPATFFLVAVVVLRHTSLQLPMLAVVCGSLQILCLFAPEISIGGYRHEILSIRTRPEPGRKAGSLQFIAKISGVNGSQETLLCRAKDLPWRNSAAIRQGGSYGVLMKLSKRSPAQWGRREERRGIHGKCIVKLISTEISNPKDLSKTFQEKVYQAVRSLFGTTTEGGIIRGMLLGDKGSIGRHTRDIFQRWGISHLLVVSGLHVGAFFVLVRFLGGVLVWPLFSWAIALSLVRFVPDILGLFAVWIYISLLGWPISGVRAAIGISTYLLFLWVNQRSTFGERTLLGGLFVISIWPGVWEELGFQLTFSALLAIAVALQWTRAYKLKKIQSLAILSILPSLFTSAVFYLHTGYVAPLAPVGNLFFSPLFVFLGFYGGMFAAGLSLVDLSLAQIVVAYLEKAILIVMFLL